MAKEQKNFIPLSFSSGQFEKRTELKAYILYIFKQEQVKIEEVNFIFCSDEYLLGLNKNFLHHNTLTDIITFTFSSFSNPIIGEIYISIERVKENAALFETSFSQEVHRVIFHGILHLCSYKDKTKAEQKAMRQKEDFYLSTYFVSRETF